MKLFRKKILHFIETRSFIELIVFFSIFTFLFAIVYCYLTPSEDGIHLVNGQNNFFNFYDGLYFSIVTISSLGYGDMHPQGLSRLFAVLEVLFGLAIMGILVAKLTSSRLSYHVKKLYSNDAQLKLDQFSQIFSECLIILKRFNRIYDGILSETPNTNTAIKSFDSRTKSVERAKNLLSDSLEKLRDNLSKLKKFIEDEVNNGDFFSEVSSDSVNNNGNRIDKYLSLILQLFLGWSEKTRNNLLYGITGRIFDESLELTNSVCEIVLKNSKDEKTKLVFSTVRSTTNEIRKNYMVILIPISEYIPPDQTNKNIENI